eukprot:scaffold28952_cov58-Attheya_sp.AAC.1
MPIGSSFYRPGIWRLSEGQCLVSSLSALLASGHCRFAVGGTTVFYGRIISKRVAPSGCKNAS